MWRLQQAGESGSPASPVEEAGEGVAVTPEVRESYEPSRA
jgi:hypothetical protein